MDRQVVMVAGASVAVMEAAVLVAVVTVVEEWEEAVLAAGALAAVGLAVAVSEVAA